MIISISTYWDDGKPWIKFSRSIIIEPPEFTVHIATQATIDRINAQIRKGALVFFAEMDDGDKIFRRAPSTAVFE